ncbi:MAG: hypothetical protein GX126_11365 [Bacteroidales bacterium]|jgi:hypothetical protein|nr:hypothetical protein [Bacteroidales bacterium]
MLREFTETGLEVFRTFLSETREGNREGFPDEILNSPNHTNLLGPGVNIKKRVFTTKKEMVLYIHKNLSRLSVIPIPNVGLWSWLAAFYFDSICPLTEGQRKVLENAKYILDTENWRKYNRHLIAAPVRLRIELGDLAEIYLAGPPNKHGDFIEQITGRQEIAVSKGIIKAATILYWDKKKERIKKGALNKKGAGVVRRFVKDIIPQFQMTYDLNAMSGNQIVDLLPPEFSYWLY